MDISIISWMNYRNSLLRTLKFFDEESMKKVIAYFHLKAK